MQERAVSSYAYCPHAPLHINAVVLNNVLCVSCGQLANFAVFPSFSCIVFTVALFARDEQTACAGEIRMRFCAQVCG